jgi:hypothetical protein
MGQTVQTETETDTTTELEPQVAETGAKEAPEGTGAQEKSQTESDQQRDEKGRFKGVQSRIDELTRARYEAEREAQYWQSVASGKAEEAKEPNRDDFADDGAYHAAKVKHEVATQVRAALADRDKARSEAANAAAEEAMHRAFAERLRAFKAEVPDVEEILRSSTVRASSAVQRGILESEHGPRIALYLDQNPAEADRLSSLRSPIALGREIARLEDKLATSDTVASTNAPAPARPVKASVSAIQHDPNRMNQQEYETWRLKQKPRWAR